MKSKNQNIADLLSNKEFINWVHQPTKQSDMYWSKWLEGHPLREEDVNFARKILQSLTFHELKDDAERSDHILKNIIEGHYSDTRKSLSGIRSKIISIVNLNWIARAAAIISFLVTFSIIANFFNDVETEDVLVSLVNYSNAKRQKSTIYLPDSTKVVLNSESTIEYPKTFADKREINLTGEAFFEVKADPSRPFIVRSGDILTTALGTSFNVKAYPTDKNVGVSLATGKVFVQNVNSNEADLMTLTPGEKSLYDIHTGQMAKVNFNIEHDLSWTEGVLTFYQSDMHEFVQTIERWYDVQVIIEGTPHKNWMISGSFNNETLKNVLESLSFARKIEYSLKGDIVKLKFKV